MTMDELQVAEQKVENARRIIKQKAAWQKLGEAMREPNRIEELKKFIGSCVDRNVLDQPTVCSAILEATAAVIDQRILHLDQALAAL